jgi:hypothetical protein
MGDHLGTGCQDGYPVHAVYTDNFNKNTSGIIVGKRDHAPSTSRVWDSTRSI